MCETCGCGEPGSFRVKKAGQDEHSHDDDHNHQHGDSHSGQRILNIGQDILQENNLLAERNRGFFDAKGIFCVNMVSAPGSGKTTLLEKTIQRLKKDIQVYVIEGDQQSMIDAERISRLEVPAVQINTGQGCHLDAHMVNHGLKSFKLKEQSVLFIENVGNLVCPALFDLGETKRILIMSVTEGDDKPIKYPQIFRSSDLCLINKIDLLPYVDFNPEQAKKNGRMVNGSLEFIEVSAKNGEGIELWYEWLTIQFKKIIH